MAFAPPTRKLLSDVGVWFGNVSSCVVIIFINKVLMNKSGYGFHYATTLSACHYLVCTLSIWLTQRLGYVKTAVLPPKDLGIFTAVANLSIVSLNLSLMINSVGFYQIAKLLVIPFVCLVEAFWLGRTFSASVIFSIATVVFGVAIVTVTGLSLDGNVVGIMVAGVSVVASGMQQILCRTMQEKHGLSSHELLANTAPAQAFSLLLLGPFLDRYFSGDWVFTYNANFTNMTVLLLSCLAAVGVNISQFMCLGRFSAVSFQVLGHSKTVLVLLGGWAFLGDLISNKQFGGMLVAVTGMVLYGYATSSKPTAPAPRGWDEEGGKKKPLIDMGEKIPILSKP